MKSNVLIMAITVVLFLAGCNNPVDKVDKNESQNSPDVDYYEQLLIMFPKEKQGYGLDTYAEGYNYQAMTYGLVLSSESIRYQSVGSVDSKERIREAVEWLLNNSTSNAGIPGWGISAEWDAFDDGTVNPIDQPYTITAAIALEGLLDALQTSNVFDTKEKKDILNTIQKVFDYYLVNTWTDLGIDSGYFWYSTNKSDDYFTPNVSSAFLGVLSRYLVEQSESVSNKEFYLKRINSAAKGIIDSVQLNDSIPFWNYITVPNKINSERSNDLVHHAYILWGIESYRSYINEINIPWDREDSIKSLNEYWKNNIIHYFPQNVVYEGENEVFNTRPTNLWGAGMLLGLYAKWNEYEKAEQTLNSIYENYGIWPKLTMYPLEYKNDGQFYTRHGAHVLWGLANYNYLKNQ